MPDTINIRIERTTHLRLNEAKAAMSRRAGRSLDASETIDALVDHWEGEPVAPAESAQAPAVPCPPRNGTH